MKGAIPLSLPRLASNPDEVPLDAAGDDGVVAEVIMLTSLRTPNSGR